MTTKRDVLTKLYNDFQLKINIIIDMTNIFPKLETTDLEDIVFYINYHFISSNNDKMIIDLLKLNKIIVSLSQLENIIKIVNDFLVIFKSI